MERFVSGAGSGLCCEAWKALENWVPAKPADETDREELDDLSSEMCQCVPVDTTKGCLQCFSSFAAVLHYCSLKILVDSPASSASALTQSEHTDRLTHRLMQILEDHEAYCPRELLTTLSAVHSHMESDRLCREGSGCGECVGRMESYVYEGLQALVRRSIPSHMAGRDLPAPISIEEELRWPPPAINWAAVAVCIERSSAHQTSEVTTGAAALALDSHRGKIDITDNGGSPLHRLPYLVWREIFPVLTFQEQIRLERVCKGMRAVVLQQWGLRRSLTCTGFTKEKPLTDKVLASILGRCSDRLIELDLSPASRTLTAFSLKTIGDLCPQLQKLDMSGMNIDSFTIKAFSGNMRELRWIRLVDCKLLCDRGLWHLLSNCQKLEYIDVSGNESVTGECFEVAGPNLKTLLLNDCKSLKRSALIKLGERQLPLEEIRLRNCSDLSDWAIELLMSHSTLKKFVAPGYFPFAKRETWTNTSQLQNLVWMELSRKRQLHPDLNPLQLVQSMMLHLTMSKGLCRTRQAAPLFSSTLRAFHNFFLLRGYCTPMRQFLREFLDVGFNRLISDRAVSALVEDCPQLRYLNLSGCRTHIFVDTLMELSRLKKLQYLNLSYMEQVDSDLANYIGEHCPLRYFILRGCPNVGDDISLVLQACPTLRLLDISDTEVTRKTLRVLRRLPARDNSRNVEVVIGGTRIMRNLRGQRPQMPSNVTLITENRASFRLHPRYSPSRRERQAWDRNWDMDWEGRDEWDIPLPLIAPDIASQDQDLEYRLLAEGIPDVNMHATAHGPTQENGLKNRGPAACRAAPSVGHDSSSNSPSAKTSNDSGSHAGLEELLSTVVLMKQDRNASREGVTSATERLEKERRFVYCLGQFAFFFDIIDMASELGEKFWEKAEEVAVFLKGELAKALDATEEGGSSCNSASPYLHMTEVQASREWMKIGELLGVYGNVPLALSGGASWSEAGEGSGLDGAVALVTAPSRREACASNSSGDLTISACWPFEGFINLLSMWSKLGKLVTFALGQTEVLTEVRMGLEKYFGLGHRSVVPAPPGMLAISSMERAGSYGANRGLGFGNDGEQLWRHPLDVRSVPYHPDQQMVAAVGHFHPRAPPPDQQSGCLLDPQAPAFVPVHLRGQPMYTAPPMYQPDLPPQGQPMYMAPPMYQPYLPPKGQPMYMAPPMYQPVAPPQGQRMYMAPPMYQPGPPSQGQLMYMAPPVYQPGHSPRGQPNLAYWEAFYHQYDPYAQPFYYSE